MANKKMGFIILIFIVVISILGLYAYRKFEIVDYTPSKYELELINYFKSVALQAEHGDNTNRIIKWRKPMFLYVVKDGDYERQTIVIKNTIEKLNELVSDGFKIELTEDSEKCNALLYLCEKEKVAQLAPNFFKKFNDDISYEISGYADIQFYWDNYNIYKASIYIDPQDSMEIQEGIILEEITQSIGLPNDPESHPNSVFYEHKSDGDFIIKEYSRLDKDVIKLLYHPRMKPGLNSKQAERMIKKILKNKEIELSKNSLR